MKKNHSASISDILNQNSMTALTKYASLNEKHPNVQIRVFQQTQSRDSIEQQKKHNKLTKIKAKSPIQLELMLQKAGPNEFDKQKQTLQSLTFDISNIQSQIKEQVKKSAFLKQLIFLAERERTHNKNQNANKLKSKSTNVLQNHGKNLGKYTKLDSAAGERETCHNYDAFWLTQIQQNKKVIQYSATNNTTEKMPVSNSDEFVNRYKSSVNKLKCQTNELRKKIEQHRRDRVLSSQIIHKYSCDIRRLEQEYSLLLLQFYRKINISKNGQLTGNNSSCQSYILAAKSFRNHKSRAFSQDQTISIMANNDSDLIQKYSLTRNNKFTKLSDRLSRRFKETNETVFAERKEKVESKYFQILAEIQKIEASIRFIYNSLGSATSDITSFKSIDENIAKQNQRLQQQIAQENAIMDAKQRNIIDMEKQVYYLNIIQQDLDTNTQKQLPAEDALSKVWSNYFQEIEDPQQCAQFLDSVIQILQVPGQETSKNVKKLYENRLQSIEYLTSSRKAETVQEIHPEQRLQIPFLKIKQCRRPSKKSKRGSNKPFAPVQQCQEGRSNVNKGSSIILPEKKDQRSQSQLKKSNQILPNLQQKSRPEIKTISFLKIGKSKRNSNQVSNLKTSANDTDKQLSPLKKFNSSINQYESLFKSMASEAASSHSLKSRHSSVYQAQVQI